MRVTVVGGGVIGRAVAFRLAVRGAGVTLVDGSGASASGVAAGMLAPVTEVHFGEVPLLAYALAAAARWPAFAAEVAAAAGGPGPAEALGYEAAGTLAVARDRDDLAALERLAAYQSSLGLDVERLGSADCRRLEPALAPGVRGGFLVAGDHRVDPRRLVAALDAAGRAAGVEVVEAWAGEVRATPGGTEVAVGDRRIPGDAVVVCDGVGPAGGRPGAWPEEVSVVRPVKGQVLRLRGGGLLQHTVRGLDAYLVPRRSGELVVGATQEERGFDTTVTAGAVLELVRAAVELVPDVAECELVETAAGLRPGTPDNAPLVGRSSTEGVVVAAGHFRNGVLLAPATADAVATLILDGRVPDGLEAFDPRRFERVGPP